MFPVAVAVSCLTALTTPWMVLAATIAATSLLRERIATGLAPETGLSPELLGTVWVSLGVGLGLILFVGVLRNGQRLARAIAALVLPLGEAGKLDLGSAPRRAFTLVLELVLALAVGMPLMAFVQPFLPLSSGMLVLALILSVLTFAAWRSIANLQGHVRAGTELIVELLARQSREGEAHPGADALEQVHMILPGFPERVPVRLEPDSPVLGQTLAALNLRARPGPTRA